MKILYYITTFLVIAIMLFSGVNDLLQNKDFVASMKLLGYPDYLMNFLGVAKILAAIILIAPIFKTAKEWAYTGVLIDLVGAAYSHAYVKGLQAAIFPLIFVVITFISYFSWKKSTKQELNL